MPDYTNIELPDYLKNDQDDEPRVVWKPLPGSQTLSLSCPASVILTHGTRGPGKTDGQLMRFRRFVGQGYGKYMRGIIFDREYKNLDDIVSKSRRWFPEFNDGAEFKTAKSDYKWVWPTGEELLFRTLKDPKDYWAYHGQEFCPHVDTIVKTNNGYVRIADVNVGDLILTPSGFKEITKKFPVLHKDGVIAKTFNAFGDLLIEQRQSVTHRTLSNDKAAVESLLHLLTDSLQSVRLIVLHAKPELSDSCSFQETLETFCSNVRCSIDEELGLALFDLYQKFEQLYSYSLHYEEVKEPALCGDLKNDNRFYSSVSNAENCDESCFHQCQDALPPHSQFYEVRELLLQLPLEHLFWLLTSIVDCEFLEFYEQFQERMEVSLTEFERLQQQLKLLKQHLCRLLQLSDVFANAHLDSETTQDYQWRCYNDHDRYDVQPRESTEIFSNIVLRLPDVEESIHQDLRVGVMGDTLKCNHDGVTLFEHPYLKNKFVQTTNSVHVGFVKYFSCGVIPTIDIEVADDNCYLTFGESFKHLSICVVNKNCWIGWNELTKYPTDELFEAMMSCNRSSFRPEDHPIKDESGNIVGYPPPLPLEVFATTNPFGPGHNWVKKRFIDKSRPGEILQTEVEVFNPRTQQREIFVKTQCHIFGSYRENIYLDPQYVAELEAIQDPNKRAAWLGGSWDITSGGMFDDVWSTTDNIVAPFMIPSSWKIFRSYDHGLSKPFSVGWWAESDGSDYTLPNGKVVSSVRGDLFRIAEWYGWTGKQNQGLNLLTTEISKGIVERELAMGIHNRVKPGPADNAIWNVEDANSVAAKMGKNVVINGSTYKGVTWTRSDKSPGSRKARWNVMRISMKNAHKRYMLMPDGTRCQIPREEPGLFVFSNCERFIDLIPSMPRDEVDLDDIDTNCEDHIADEAGYAVASTSLYKAYKNIKGT